MAYLHSHGYTLGVPFHATAWIHDEEDNEYDIDMLFELQPDGSVATSFRSVNFGGDITVYVENEAYAELELNVYGYQVDDVEVLFTKHEARVLLEREQAKAKDDFIESVLR